MNDMTRGLYRTPTTNLPQITQIDTQCSVIGFPTPTFLSRRRLVTPILHMPIEEIGWKIDQRGYSWFSTKDNIWTFTCTCRVVLHSLPITQSSPLLLSIAYPYSPLTLSHSFLHVWAPLSLSFAPHLAPWALQHLQIFAPYTHTNSAHT